MRKNKKAQPRNLKMAGWFSLAVVTLIILSGILKFIILIEESRFDGSHFTLEITNKNEFISFSPKDSSINVLRVADGSNIAKKWEIPVDVKINSREEFTKENLSRNLLLLSFKRQINFLDSIKLFIFSISVKDNSFNEKSISSSDDKTKVQSVLTSSFSDPTILEERQSIEIINSADIPGLGNRLANYITNMGGNVILVTTGDIKDKSEIKYLNKTYTLKKISEILSFESSKEDKKGLGDIVITIGKDSQKNTPF